MGAAGSVIASRLAMELDRVIRSERDVLAIEGLFALPAPANRCRRPDVAYVPAARVPSSWPPPCDDDPIAFDAVPTLAVEVVSPTDRIVEVETKRREYFAVGVTTVAVVFPTLRIIHVYDSASTARILTESDILDLNPAVPGFSVPVADLFAPLNPPSQP
jgi:Uma2 family endonuclease